MKRIMIVLCLINVVVLESFAYGATVIESRDGAGEIQRIWIEGAKMRVESAAEPGYMLIDAPNKKMYVIDPVEKQVMDMSGILQQKSSPGTVTHAITLQSRGRGPVIAGYATDHYQVMVNGKKCTDEYLSLQALREVESTDMFAALSHLGEMGMPAGAMGMMDPCDTADVALQETYGTYGFPLRIVNRDGALDTEVLRIQKNVPLPPGGFALPAGYPVKSFDEMMPQNMPEMETPSMQDMPQDFDPAEFEKRMQEMMKKMGRE